MRVTQKDIANRLNLSQSLVAGVLADKPGIWVSPANRERIQKAAREMGYRPNAAARSLRSGKSDSVGFVVLHPADGPEGGRLPLEYGGIVEALTQFLDPRGYGLSLKTFADPGLALDGLSEMAQTRAADVFVLCGPSSEVERQAERLEELRAFAIILGCLEEPHPRRPQIDFDHLDLMRLSVGRLTSLGHRRIAYLGHDNSEPYSRRLEAGFRLAMRAAGVADPLMHRLEAGRDGRAEAQMSHWLDLPDGERPTAVVVGASDDTTWRGLEIALARRGRRLGEGPGEFAATGLHHTMTPLLFGQAWGFCQTDLGHLTETLCHSLLGPLLAGETPADPVLRVCPAGRPMPSLRLLEYVRFRNE